MALDLPNETVVNIDTVHDASNANFCFKAKTNQNAPRPWVCKICNFPFKFKGNLLEHMRFYHMKGNVPCNRCDKTFPSSKVLRKHMREHSLARNMCPHCGSKLSKASMYIEHLKVCKRRPKNKLITMEVSQTFVSSETEVNPVLPQKRQKPDTCNDEFSKQCALCWLKFKDDNTFQDHQCLPTATSKCSFVESAQKRQKLDTSNNEFSKQCALCWLKFKDESEFQSHQCLPADTSKCNAAGIDLQKQPNSDTNSTDIPEKHCTMCHLKFMDDTKFLQHKCSPVVSSACNEMVPYPTNTTSACNTVISHQHKTAVSTCNMAVPCPAISKGEQTITSLTTPKSVPNLSTRGALCNQQRFRNNAGSFSMHENYGINAASVIYNTRTSMAPYTQILPHHQELPHYYRNDFNAIPSPFGSCAHSYTNRFLAQPHLYNDFTKMNSFSSMEDHTRSPLQCLSHITASLENQQPCNMVSQPFPPKVQMYQLNGGNSSNIHCAECQHPLPLTVLNSRDFVPHICPYCSVVYRRVECLDNHIATIHAVGLYRNPNFHNSIPSDHNSWFCSSCKRYFCDHQAFVLHIQQCFSNQHKNTTNTWYCVKCKSTFNTELHFLQHTALCQSQKLPFINEKSHILKRNENTDPSIELQEISKLQNRFANINECNKSNAFNPPGNKQSNSDCTKCQKISIACGKEKLCVPCSLKMKLNEDFEMIKKYKISLHPLPQSILYKHIDSHVFKLSVNHSVKCYFCGNCFDSIPPFYTHIRNCDKFKNNPAQNFLITCCDCSRNFTTIISFQAHTFNCQSTQNCNLKTSDSVTESIHEKHTADRSLQATKQSSDKKDIWECELCGKEFSNLLVFAIHMSSCKSNTQSKKEGDNLKAEKQISESDNTLANSSESSLPPKHQHVFMYCKCCGHRFKSRLELHLHPCNENIKYMTSCYVQLEYLKFNKLVMKRLFSLYGYPNGLQEKKKRCLSYRQRYNEVFQSPSEQTIVLKSDSPRIGCHTPSVHLSKDATKRSNSDCHKLLAELVSECDKKFNRKSANFPAEIYSQKFVCSCGQVRPFLQASVHMKIHKNSAAHQIKFLKPLLEFSQDSGKQSNHIFCKSCKRHFHDLELFAGHTAFSFACRKLYKTSRNDKFVRNSDDEEIPPNHDLSGIKLNQITKDSNHQKNCLKEECNLAEISSEIEIVKTTDINDKSLLSLNSQLPSTHAMEFSDKVANFIKSEMSSTVVTTQQQSMIGEHSLSNDNAQKVNDAKSKTSKRFTSSDGFMVEVSCTLGDSSIISKYICASCYRSLYSKASLIEHLKEEHRTQGVIKLSVIKNQTSHVQALQTVNSSTGNVIKEHFNLSNPPIITSTFSFAGANMDVIRKCFL